MKSRSGIRSEINKIYTTRVTTWLTEHVKDNHEISGFPFRIYLGASIRDEDAVAHKDELLAFCEDWHHELTAGKVDFLEKEYPGIGKVEVPVHLVFEKPDEIVTWTGHLVEYRTALKRLDIVAEKIPSLVDSALENIFALTTLDDIDFERFVDVCRWLVKNPDSGKLIREMKIRGVDTAWFEKHRGLLLIFLRDYLNLNPLRKDLRQLGLVPPPALVRVVILDHVLRNKAGNLRYLAVPVQELADLDIKPSRVIFMEDVASALALPDVPGVVVVILPPYSLSELCSTSWIVNAKCTFAGSVSVRSFVLLNNVRVYLPETASALMNVQTFMDNKDLWTPDDPSALNLETPMLLNDEESALYQLLVSGTSSDGLVRIAQERIPFEMLCSVVGAKVTASDDDKSDDEIIDESALDS